MIGTAESPLDSTTYEEFTASPLKSVSAKSIVREFSGESIALAGEFSSQHVLHFDDSITITGSTLT